MKIITKYLIHAIASIIGLLCFVSAFSQIPIAYYQFNNNAIDLSGNNNNGNIYGNVSSVADRFGYPCSALLFDGSTGYIEVPTSSSLESPQTDLTITLWYKLTNINSDNYWLTVLCKGAGETEVYNPHYRLQVQQNKAIRTNPCSQYIPMEYSTISLNTKFTICDPDVTSHFFDPGVWHFYALSYNGSSVKTFMDGKKIFEFPYSQTLLANNSSLFIGKDEPGATEYFNGALDELKIYNVCLSEKEVAESFSDKNPNAYSEDFDIETPNNIILNTGSKTCAVKTTFNNPSYTASCSKVNVQQIEGLSSGSEFPLGDNRIRYKLSTASDYNQFVTFYVIVNDVIPPVMITPKDVKITVGNGEKGIIFNYKNPIATDNCKIKTIIKTSGNSSGDFFEIGKNKITYTATDESGNSTSADFYVEVIEKKSKIPTVIKKTDSIVNTITIHDTLSIIKTDTIHNNKTDTITIQKTDTVYVNNPSNNPIVTTDVYTDTLSVKLYKPSNLLFLIDVSGSMIQEDNGEKMRLTKLSLQTLIKKLRNIDKLTILTYSDATTTIFSTSLLYDRPGLVALIGQINAKGGTNGAEAIETAYGILKSQFDPNAENEIYMFTDGQIDDITKKQKKLIKSNADDPVKRIKFNMLAFGNKSNYLSDMKMLTNLGSGNFISINTDQDALETLITLVKLNSKY